MVFIALFILYLFVFVQPAQAYLDPGTGSYFIQILIASSIGFGLFFRTFWSSIKAFVTKLRPPKDTSISDDQD